MKKRIIFIIFLLVITCVFFYFYSKKESDSNKNNIELKKDSISSKVVVGNFLFPQPTKNQIIQHYKYSLSYNENHEQAEWVAYKLDKNSINNAVKRRDHFREDTMVATGSATLADYKNSGFDRGHLAPAKAMSFDKQSMSESFYMSNMSPQKPSFNRGVWKRLEEEVRSWIPMSDSLYVITGPILKDSLGVIGNNKVTIPKYYYKSIVRFKDAKLYGIGFLLENKKSDNAISSFVVSIDSIEKVSGLDFFYKLDLQVQSVLEKNQNYQYFLQK